MTIHSMPHAPRYSLLPEQMVRILGITYTVVRATPEGWLMLADGDHGFMREFTNAEIAGFVARRQISSVKAAPGQPPSRGATCVTALLSGKPAPVQDAAMRKLAWCEAFAQLEAERRVRRTDASIDMAMAEIERSAKRIRFKQRHPDREKPDANYTCDLQTAPSARTLRRWLSAYHEEQLAGLVQGTLSGQRGSTLPGPLQELLKRETRAYLKFQGPTIKKIHEAIEDRVADLNEQRSEDGLEALQTPSYETVRRYIHDRYDAFQIACARKGPVQARREFKPVGRGLEIFHPLQRVEIDEWTTDLHAISDWLSLDGILDEQDRERLGFDKSIHRWAITVAMDSATRCILGIVISRNPGSHAALQLLKLILMDKTAHAHALGARESWHMHGVPVLIATDNGTAFTSADFHMACADLGLTFQRTVAGQPQLRGRIERFFRTIALQLIPDTPGATSSKLIGLAGVDPAKFAALGEGVGHAVKLERAQALVGGMVEHARVLSQWK